MEKSIVITVNLLGTVGGPKKHKDYQRHTIETSEGPVTRTIYHTNRDILPCSKRINVSGEVVTQWVSDICPDWEDPRRWKRMTYAQRMTSYLYGFDEGYGVSFEEVN